MDSLRSTRVLAASSVLAALGVYALYNSTRRSGSPRPSRLIDSPEAIARKVGAKDDGRSHPNEDPQYDVVVIGGGTSGCVVAARLSEDPGVHVLLLEAGGSSLDVKECQIPSAYPRLMNSHMDYKLFTEPQANAGGVSKYWPRAKLLGGCSAMNAMIFHVGAPSDYDEWARSGQEGAAGWSYKNFQKYLFKFEKYIPHAKYPTIDASLRGSNGPVKVGFFSTLHAICAQWIDTCVKIGMPFNPDVNTSAGTLGVTKVMTYIDSKGRRVTTENAYLTPDVLKRPNLKVAVNAHVTRILIETHGGTKKAVGVEFAKVQNGPRYRVRARREVVLSAGAVHSPHILMLSGVGPKEHLADHNIPLVHHLPGVGQNLQDHVYNIVRLRVKKGLSIVHIREPRGLQVLQVYIDYFKWSLFGTGALSTNLCEAGAFMRTDDAKLFPPDGYDIKDETSGPNAPDLELIVVPVGYGGDSILSTGDRDFLTLGSILLRPQSRGTVTLKSANPFDAPAIDPRYLSTQNDVSALVRAFRLQLRIAQAEPLAASIVPDDSFALDHNLHRLTDAELELEVRKRAQTIYHPTSTCRMTRLEDGGVVDAYLRVYGIEHLRVADASIFPRITAGHTAAPCIAVGEKAADMIKESLLAR